MRDLNSYLVVGVVVILWIQTLYLVFSLKISIRHRKIITIIFSWLSYYVVYILNSYAISNGYVVIFVRMARLVHIVYFWSYFMLLISTNLCKKQSGHCMFKDVKTCWCLHFLKMLLFWMKMMLSLQFIFTCHLNTKGHANFTRVYLLNYYLWSLINYYLHCEIIVWKGFSGLFVYVERLFDLNRL